MRYHLHPWPANGTWRIFRDVGWWLGSPPIYEDTDKHTAFLVWKELSA